MSRSKAWPSVTYCRRCRSRALQVSREDVASSLPSSARATPRTGRLSSAVTDRGPRDASGPLGQTPDPPDVVDWTPLFGRGRCGWCWPGSPRCSSARRSPSCSSTRSPRRPRSWLRLRGLLPRPARLARPRLAGAEPAGLGTSSSPSGRRSGHELVDLPVVRPDPAGRGGHHRVPRPADRRAGRLTAAARPPGWRSPRPVWPCSGWRAVTSPSAGSLFALLAGSRGRRTSL